MTAQASKGFAFSLSLLPWDVFSTLTFKNPLPNERCRWRLAWRHLHQVSESLGVPYSRLLIALRSEHGELGDRPHFHFLIGECGASNNHTLAFEMAYQWKLLSQGHAVNRAYDSGLAGPDYIEACLGGGNVYELGKFNRADRLELSVSVLNRVRSSLRRGVQNSANQATGKNMGAAEVPTGLIGATDNPLLSQALTSSLP